MQGPYQRLADAAGLGRGREAAARRLFERVYDATQGASGQTAQTRAGMANPIPQWLRAALDPANESVFDSTTKKALTAAARFLGLDDLEGQVLGVLNPAETVGKAVLKRPIRAYHGSPHDFDQFSLGKIGTGEGAQAYGHGLYFAESPEVAKTYQAKVPAMQGGQKPTIGGRAIDWDNPAETAAFELWRHNGDRQAAAEFYARTFNRDSPVVSLLRSGDPLPSVTPPGRMYEVNIHADPDDFLDWDAPLSQQTQQRLSGVIPKGKVSIPPEGLDMSGGGRVFDNRDGKIANKPYPYILKSGDAAFGLSESDVARMLSEGGTGNQAYTRLTATLGSQDKATEALKQAGIPGIKYFDGASRGKGEGSRNYVVFDDKLIEIVKKYGIAGALGAGLINESQARQLQEQGYP